MRVKDFVRKGLSSISRGYGSTAGGGYFGGSFQGGGRDWNREAGLRFDNSIVYALIMGAWNFVSEADFYVARPNSSGGFDEVPNHPVTRLLENPNPWYEGTTMLGASLVSEFAGPGYSCLYKHRSSAGKVVALEYVPHFGIWPYTNPGSGNFIDYWQLSVSGGYKAIDPRDILMTRFGFANPMRPQTCVGPILAAMLELVTDKGAAQFSAAMLANIGVTPHIISPMPQRDQDGGDVIFTQDQAEEIKAAFEEGLTRSNVGKPFVSPLSIKIDKISMNPEEMNLESLRNISEERLCAVMGIHPLSVYLGTALEQSNNRASSSSAFQQTARTFTKPYGIKRAKQLTRDLIPELGEPGEVVLYRYDSIEALQADRLQSAQADEIETRTHKTINEKREEKGLKPHPDGDRFVSRGTPSSKKKNTEPEEDPEEED